jgi:superoxide dismutase, Fe-Mn family
MTIKLTNLPYPIDALEPYISKFALKTHYGKHHKKYVDTLNQLIANTSYDRMDLEEIMLKSHGVDQDVFNNAAQDWNHTFFWDCMVKNGSRLSSSFSRILDKSFGSFESFKKEFSKVGAELFGSGWVWLVRDELGELKIRPMKDAENPLVISEAPLLVCDVWEHAYYLDYQHDRAQFLENFWKLVNWDFVEANLDRKVSDAARVKKEAARDDDLLLSY